MEENKEQLGASWETLLLCTQLLIYKFSDWYCLQVLCTTEILLTALHTFLSFKSDNTEIQFQGTQKNLSWSTFSCKTKLSLTLVRLYQEMLACLLELSLTSGLLEQICPWSHYWKENLIYIYKPTRCENFCYWNLFCH